MPVAQSSLHEIAYSGAWPIVSKALMLLEHLSHWLWCCLRRASRLKPCPLNIDLPRRDGSGDACEEAGSCVSEKETLLAPEPLRQLATGVGVVAAIWLQAT